MGDRIHIEMQVIGDPADADRCLDAMEQETGLRGEPTGDGRAYAIDGENLSAAADMIVAHLPAGWQDHLALVL